MNIYLELLLVAVVVVYIVALSGWTQTWLGWLSKALHRAVKGFRPFSCAQCMTWWCCLLWALIRGKLSLPVVAASAGLAFYSITLENILIFLQKGTLWCIRKLNKLWTQED